MKTPTRLPTAIKFWFAADLVLVLLPPLHWWLGNGTPILGVPLVLVYLFGVSAFVAASVVAAYLSDRSAR